MFVNFDVKMFTSQNGESVLDGIAEVWHNRYSPIVQTQVIKKPSDRGIWFIFV